MVREMTDGQISICMGVFALLLQGVNIWTSLSIRAAILESERRQSREVDEKLEAYALEQICKLRHEREITRRSAAA
jgi:hypothetical protein